MPRLHASERYALYRERRAELVRAGLESGRFTYQQRGARIRCTFCGQTGWSSGIWLDNCLKGHPFVCHCGRVFATKRAISMHRRHMEGDIIHAII